MAMDTTTAAALVGGRPRQAPDPRMRIWVLRAFMFDGKRVEPGQVVEMDRGIARELISSGKAEVVQDKPPPATPPGAPRAPARGRKDDDNAQ